ncbi:hypothetical protein NC651_027067 [Populus alba x Populus x berolinensis]|nr:hypothetical protein NC651_027067 [Populus alba x Populus x berolinensis]
MNFPSSFLFILLLVSFSHLLTHSSLAIRKFEGFCSPSIFLSLRSLSTIIRCHLKIDGFVFQIPE